VCGIAGVWGHGGHDQLGSALSAMVRELGHRGPDAQGTWEDEGSSDTVRLGHTRLAIQDLSENGAQPMVSRCERFVITLNGEIYNHWELRMALDPTSSWRGRSDTETLVEAVARWGIEKTLGRVNGMFGFAVWDRQERSLWLARDPLGEKPLYWGNDAGRFFFASELGAILRSGLTSFRVSQPAVHSLLNLGYIPDPGCIVEGVEKLPPGALLEVREGTNGWSIQRHCYWSLEGAADRARSTPALRSDGEWEEAVEKALTRSVQHRLLADVPVGAFLSGGVDSGLITALMSRVSPEAVRTFTVDMPGDWSEAPRARRMAEHLGTRHTEIPITEQDCLEVIPKLPGIYSEPLGDSSQVPTYLVAEAARKHVTVVLSGDGGDELFAGYNRHVIGGRIWRSLSQTPMGLRRAGDRALQTPLGREATKGVSWLLSGGGRRIMRSLRIQKAAGLLGAQTEADLYRRLVVQWPEGTAPLEGNGDWSLPLPTWVAHRGDMDVVDQLAAYDTELALPGDMLVKVDRATMAHALEARVPFLDPDLVELSLSVPIHLKTDGRQGKLLLRRILSRHAPPGWMDEPAAARKIGFGIPIARWLRGELRDWAEEILNPAGVRETPYLDPVAVQKQWRAFQKGAALEHPIWSLLMYRAWHEEYREALTAT